MARLKAPEVGHLFRKCLICGKTFRVWRSRPPRFRTRRFQPFKLRAGKSRVKFQIIPEEGKVLVVLVGPPAREKEDPALKPFLNLLTRDMKENPQRIRPFPVDLLNRARSVVENVEVDLNGPLTGED